MSLALQETIDDLYHQLAEVQRRQSNLVRPGSVKSFDAAKGTAKLDVGMDTHDVPVVMPEGVHHPLKVGQKVLMLCPDGDPASGAVMHFGNCDATPAPSDRSDEKMTRHGEPGSGATWHVRDSGKALIGVKSQADLKIYLVGSKQFFVIKPECFALADPEEVK